MSAVMSVVRSFPADPKTRTCRHRDVIHSPIRTVRLEFQRSARLDTLHPEDSNKKSCEARGCLNFALLYATGGSVCRVQHQSLKSQIAFL
jgi:hypothetical protein